MGQDITLTLTLEEVNKVLKALAEEPFVQVFEVIGKINEQADIQLRENTTENNKK